MRKAILSDKGGREVNEDAVGRLRNSDIYCFALADGLGGHGGGDIASQLAVSTVLQCFKTQADIAEDMMEAYFEAAQHAVNEKSEEEPKLQGMRTTLVTLLTDGERAIWMHCGDSRLYRLKKHLIQEITDDHSVAFASFLAGDIDYDEIRNSPDQNKLIRTIGGNSKSRPDISEAVKVGRNTSFLLCSDGFWEYVDEDHIESTRKKASSPRDWLIAMEREIKRNAPPDADNYSAIAVYI
ncbi:MAG: serine/threonine-protein phosphatase [Clostridia bacterium]|nr:serine/threonine-protein phosphatase [Clostridia bacterium]